MTRDAFIDPGYSRSGDGSAVAYYRDRRLVVAWFLRPGVRDRGSLRIDLSRIVVEKPQVDSRTAQSVATIVELSWQGAALAYLLAGCTGAEVVELTPSKWKRSAHKPQHHHALWEILDDGERAILGGQATAARIEAACVAGAADRWRKRGGEYYPKTWLTHNLLDAAALGATYYGRLRVGG